MQTCTIICLMVLRLLSYMLIIKFSKDVISFPQGTHNAEGLTSEKAHNLLDVFRRDNAAMNSGSGP